MTTPAGETTWQCTTVLEGHLGAVYDLAPDGADGLWSVGGDGCLVRWSRQDGQWNLMGEARAKADEALFCLHVLPDGTVVSGGASGGILSWRSGQVEFYPGHDGGTFVIDGPHSGGADGALRQWESGKPVAEAAARIRCVLHRAGAIWLGTHEGMVIRAGDRKTVRLHDGSLRALLDWPGKSAVGSAGADGRIRIWTVDDAGEWTEVLSVEAHKGTVYRLTSSPDGQWVASSSRDRSVAVWNAKDMSLQARLTRTGSEGHLRSVNALCWLDDRTLAAGGDDRRILIWERKDT
jgi:WD40 repeat protein